MSEIRCPQVGAGGQTHRRKNCGVGHSNAEASAIIVVVVSGCIYMPRAWWSDDAPAGRQAGGGRPRRLCVIAGEHDICSDLFDRRSSRRLRQLRGETPIKHRAKLPRRVDRHDGYERRRASTPWCPYDGYNFDSTAVRLHIKGH